ncbi:hypothetical protein HJC99_05745 [Candidatus Saccharibacteria bacterium]|nr:hypothetical protein [Candidatus Saccharibacteria bacterium]
MTGIHNLMAKNGDGNKLIWITEFGAPTSGRGGTNDVFVSEDTQAQILSQAAALYHKQSWSGPLFWYNWQDSNGDSSENHYGLVRVDGSHKPAYDVLTALTRKIS